MNRERNRSIRLSQIQYFLHRNPAGLTTRELAAMCNTGVRNIQRDLLILQADMHVPIISKANHRYGIKKDYLLPPVAYTLNETLALFLSARLMVRQTDRDNPHIRSALQKLISLMPPPLAAQLNRSITALSHKPADSAEVDVFEKAALAWCTQRRLRIIYSSMRRQRTETWIVSPYCIEMTGVGYSVYLVGYAENAEIQKLETFKLNRIKEAEILDETFEIPPDLDINQRLVSSWGIICGEDTPVKIKFSPAVTSRVKETIWHPSQQIEDLPDGGCLVTLKVGSTLEMTPWLRGWGPDLEVLEPLELREQFKGWARRLAEMYNH